MRRAFGDEPVDQRGREIQEGAAIVEVHGTKPEAPGPQPGRLADANRLAVRPGDQGVPLACRQVAPFDVEMDRGVMEETTQS